jgi:hypothetical protein
MSQREAESMNSIGNLMHLCGNVWQWIVAGIGDEKDTRQRPKEFSERGPIPITKLLRRLDEAVANVQKVLVRASASDPMRTRCIQRFDVNGLEAIFDSAPHFRGHTQEIIHITRSI